ncbi:hypothetical protein AMTRI_Chr01g113750 [Amborella trichopoda]
MSTPEGEDLVEIIEDAPLDLTKYINHVRNPSSGAIATFSGTTRDSFNGKRVLELRYEAYIPMAIRELRSICSSARSKWKIKSIALAHRLGVVPVGEDSVFVAASSVHRIDALNACKFLIDEIKARVPIWKKEVYENGEVWKENSEFFLKKFGLSEEAKACDGSEKPGFEKLGFGDGGLGDDNGQLGLDEGGGNPNYGRSSCCRHKERVSSGMENGKEDDKEREICD